MTDFSGKSNTVQQDIDEIRKYTDMVHEAVKQATEAINDAAERAVDVSDNISGINSEAEKATRISDSLGDTVSKFKVE